MHDLLDSGVLARAVVTNLGDRSSSQASDNSRLDYIAGSLLLREPWDKMRSWQQANAPDGLGLILHRPFGGLQNLDAVMYRRAANRVLSMLRPGGVLFAQVPRRIANFS